MTKRLDHDRFGGTIETLRSRPAQLLVVAYIGVAIWYLWWRVSNTINPEALVFSWTFLAADILGFGFFLLFATTLWSRVRRTAAPAPPGLTVDVYIPTYNEPANVLRPTIAASIAMDYPHKTYVLDDGRRDEVRALCEELGVEYLTRPDNTGAKAGNINAALTQTSGEFVAIFDADHVPFRNFLTDLLGYFNDPKVALAQAPQAYYNLDSFQHDPNARSDRDVRWHEQSVFYDRIMPGKDRFNAAFWCGSSAIVRRTALEEVGGVDIRTVTEDMHTAMQMHARGWKSVYHDRELALGIAPDDASSFLGQRLRWAQGAAQIVRMDNPLFKRGLSFKQRIAYFTSVLYVIEYLPKVVYLLTPAVALALDVLPMQNMGWNLLWRFGPYYLLGMLATRALTGQSNPFFQAERFHLLKMWIMIQALTAAVWPGKLSFKVTQKDGDTADHRVRDLALVRWQMVAGGLCVLAAIWAVSAIAFTGWDRNLTGASLAITLAWAMFNAGMVVAVMRWVWRRPHRRAVYRFPLDQPVLLSSGNVQEVGRLVDISGLGVGWKSSARVQAGDRVALRISAGLQSYLEVDVRVTSCRPIWNGYRCAATFEGLNDEGRRTLLLFLYQQLAPRSLTTAQPAQPATPLEFGTPLPKAS